MAYLRPTFATSVEVCIDWFTHLRSEIDERDFFILSQNIWKKNTSDATIIVIFILSVFV